MFLFIVQSVYIVYGHYTGKEYEQYMVFPLFFALSLLIAAIGPLSSGEVSYRSQKDRFLQLSEEMELIENKKLKPVELTSEQTKTVLSVIDFMEDTRNLDRFIEALDLKNSPDNKFELFTALKINQNPLDHWKRAKALRRKPFTVEVLDVSNYNTVLKIRFYGLEDTAQTDLLKSESTTYPVTMDPVNRTLSVKYENRIRFVKLEKKEDLVFESKDKSVRFIGQKLGYFEDNSGNITSVYAIEGYLLIQ